MPLAMLLIAGLPTRNLAAHFPLYLAVTVAFGLLIAWCGSGCNSPLFAEIVPARKRSLVYAFDRCFEGAIASCAAPLVGVIAERVFGFDAAAVSERGGGGGGAAAGAGGSARARADAAALGASLLWCLCVPWALCFCIYFGLYATYPEDRARLKASRSGAQAPT